MRYSYVMPAAAIHWMAPTNAGAISHQPIARARAEQDRRWPMVLRKLGALRKRGRRSIRIVDANCGAGELLMLAVRRARELGFVAIEGRGIDRDAESIARARRSSTLSRDPAIGLVFEVGDARQALREEAEFPADLVLYADQENRGLAAVAKTAGRTVLRGRPDRAAQRTA